MKLNHPIRRVLAIVSLLAAISLPQQFLHAQTTWSGAGTDDLWSTPANWGGITPTDGSTLVFDGVTRLNNTNDLSLSAVAGIQFNTGGFVLNGNGIPLSTGNGITNNAGTNIVGMNLRWGTAGNLYAAPDTELVISGILTNPFTSGSNVVYKGGGRIRYTGGYLQISNPPATIINNAEVVIDGGTFTNGGGIRITSDPNSLASKLILTNGASVSQIIQGGAFRVGDTASTMGQLFIHNSSISAVSNIMNIPFIANGLGQVTQTGGTNSGCVINLNNGAGGTGSYDMTGGVLAVYQIKKGNASGTGTISFDGSVLRALPGAQTAFFTGLNTAEIKAGGLTLDSNGEGFTLGQIFTGEGRLTKMGAGTVTVNGASTLSGGLTVVGSGTVALHVANFTGGIILTSGTLQVGASLTPSIGTLALNGGTIRSTNASAPKVISCPVTLGGNVTYSTSDLDFSAAQTLTGNRTLTVNNTNTISGTIGESGGARTLTKAGTGILILSAVDNNYSGGTVVSAGTLRAINASGNATGSGTTVVTNTGTLAGTGRVAALTLVSGGKVAPGLSVGTLAAGNTTFGTAGGYQLEMTDANPNLAVGVGRDFLNIQGTLDITATSGSPIVVDLSSAGGLAANFNETQTNSWIIATATGGITGFSSDKFVVTTTNFQNSLGTNAFSIAVSGNNLLLKFGAAPTPSPTINPNLIGAGTTSVQMSFSSVSGAGYTVQYKTNLNQVNWLNLTNFTATGSTSTVVDNTSPVPAERYYRVTSP